MAKDKVKDKGKGKEKEDFEKFSRQWEKALEPIEGEKVILFPKDTIKLHDSLKWPEAASLKIKLPIGPLESMFAMYHWYLFFGRHLLPQEILELANGVFPGMGIKNVSFIDKIEKPVDPVAVVLKSLDDVNKDRLMGRCHRWFTNYLKTNRLARTRARHLLGFRGRLEILPGQLPIVGGREIETWEALIHYGVLDSSIDRHGQRLEKQTAGNVLLYYYSNSPNVSGAVQRPITTLSTKLEHVRLDSDDVSIANAVVTVYKKQERFWADKAQDIVYEYEHGTHNWNPPRIEGRSLEVPSGLTFLLGLKHSHITLNSSDAGPLKEIFTKLPPINFDNLPQVIPGPKTVPNYAGSSAHASAAGSYQPYDPSTLSQRQEMHNMPSNQSFRAQYQRHHQAPPQGDPMSVVTTDMGNLSMTTTALGSSSERIRYNEAPGPSRDRPRYNDEIFASTPKAVEEQESEEELEPKKSKSSKESRRKEKHPKKHDRSETPPEKQQSSKRQTGNEPRGNRHLLPFGPGEDERKQR